MSRRPMSLYQVYDDYRSDAAFEHFRTPGIHLVPGYGMAYRPLAMVVGEAPGATENANGRPFCGPSGRVLNGLLENAGLRLDSYSVWADDGIGNYGNVELPANAYVTNVVKYRPPGNRKPTPGEIEASRPYLRREWRALGRPPIIIAVGSTAKECLLANDARSITKLAGMQIEAAPNVWIVPQFHPAFGLRRQQMRSLMEKQWDQLGEWIEQRGLADESGNRRV